MQAVAVCSLSMLTQHIVAVPLQVVQDIQKALHTKSEAAEADTTPKGQPSYMALFATLAWQCASTFRCVLHPQDFCTSIPGVAGQLWRAHVAHCGAGRHAMP